MSAYLGDIRLGDTIDLKFTTVTTTGAPTTLAGSPAVAAYPANSTTEVTGGITLSVDLDSRTGLNNVRIVASSGNGYATATNYTVVITAGTVGGTSVIGYEVGSFSIEARSALMPTTAARTAAIDASGRVDLGLWVGVAPNALTQGKVDGLAVIRSATAQAGAASSITLDASASATSSLYFGLVVLIVSGAGAGQARLVTSYNGGTKVAGVKPDWTTAPDNTSVFMLAPHAAVDVEQWSSSNVASPDTAGYPKITIKSGTGTGELSLSSGLVALSAAGVQSIWDALTAALTTANSIGKLLVDNINATISSRLATSGYTAPLDAAGTRTAVGLASANLDTQLSTIAGYLDTEIAAILAAVDTEVADIKLKTDSLTFTKAGQVDGNMLSIKGTTVNGDGGASPWGP